MADTGSIRILIAEDDDNARTLLVELLNTMGHVVVAEVSGGRDAIERAKDVVPDVVLLDVHMPDGSGSWAALGARGRGVGGARVPPHADTTASAGLHAPSGAPARARSRMRARMQKQR